MTSYGYDYTHEEEEIARDEEDHGNHARAPVSTTQVPAMPLPIPTTTDATQASIKQMAAVAISDDDTQAGAFDSSSTQGSTKSIAISHTKETSSHTVEVPPRPRDDQHNNLS